MSKKIEAIVEGIVSPVVSALGYEYIGTEIVKVGSEIELIIYADKDGGLELEDCETISRAIDDLIEEADPIKEGYYLCVSSPGLDRPLKSEADYKRSIGKTVDVKLYRAQDNIKMCTGQLKSFDGEGFTRENQDGEKVFLYKDTAIVRLHIDI